MMMMRRTWRWVAVHDTRSSQVAAAWHWTQVSSVLQSSACCAGLALADLQA